MLNELRALYRTSLVSQDTPKCRFPETLIFNEGWLLRSVLNGWLGESGGSRFGFLPFPPGVTCYSEGQLYTPFKPGSHREGNTHVDGIVGDFSMTDTKSGIRLNPDLRYIAAFEAKLYSPLSADVTYAPGYDQLSRTAACLISSILGAAPTSDYSAHLVVVRAQDNRHIDPAKYGKDHIEQKIADRLRSFLAASERTPVIERFTAGWKEVFERLRLHHLTWEEVVADLSDDRLSRFYDLCNEFARPGRQQPANTPHPS